MPGSPIRHLSEVRLPGVSPRFVPGDLLRDSLSLGLGEGFISVQGIISLINSQQNLLVFISFHRFLFFLCWFFRVGLKIAIFISISQQNPDRIAANKVKSIISFCLIELKVRIELKKGAPSHQIQ